LPTFCSLIEHLFEGVRLGVNATVAPTPHAEALRELSKTEPLCFFNVAHFPLSLCRETVALLQAHLEAAAASIRESLLDVFDSARAHHRVTLATRALRDTYWVAWRDFVGVTVSPLSVMQ
jgi:hypothetical protein